MSEFTENLPEEEYDEEEEEEEVETITQLPTRTLLLANNGRYGDFLDTNCSEFNPSQYALIESDKSGAETSRSLEKDGASRFDEESRHNALTTKCFCLVECSCGLGTSINFMFLEKLYKIQRDQILSNLDGVSKDDPKKKAKTPGLSAIFPVYQTPTVTPIRIKVTCQIKTSKPETKQIEITREEGMEKVVAACKAKFKGISKSDVYKLAHLTGEEEFDDSDLMELTHGKELRLVLVNRSASTTSTSSHVASLKLDNSIKNAINDVDRMTFPISLNFKFHTDTSMFAYLVYWAANLLNGLEGRIKDTRGKVIEPPMSEAVDCLISLQRAIRDLRFRMPSGLIRDAQAMEEKLSRRLERHDLLRVVFDRYPELITNSCYDKSVPRLNRLYEEQAEVLDLLHGAIGANKKLLLGYRVPPSGGKTSLSIAIASMIRKYHPNKQLLYVCYNTLVRMSVATGCHQASIPYWVAAFGRGTRGEPQCSIRVSYSAQRRTAASIRKAREAYSKNKKGNKGSLADMWDRAKMKTAVSHVPIIISDIVSAYELLQLFPENFVLYLDEPTAGAENGEGENSMQEWVARLLTTLPQQSVMLSATLPDIPTELPTLTSLVGRENIQMVNNHRLPVGAVAVGPDGRQILPHELASNHEEFCRIVSYLQQDALMQRFYTPHPVRRLIECVASTGDLPAHLHLQSCIPFVGDVSHGKIRRAAIDVLVWIASLPSERAASILDALKALPIEEEPKPIISDSFIEDHIASEGRALAVTTPTISPEFQAIYDQERVDSGLEPRPIEPLDELVRKALGPLEPSLPDAHHFHSRYLAEREGYLSQIESFQKAGKTEEAQALLKDAPEFNWPVQVAGFSAVLSDVEIQSLDQRRCAQMLSGIGVYEPAKMNTYEQSIVMREAGQGHLACLFSSPDIVYGTNMALITVYIGEGYGRSATRNSLYQLIGRAGRTGKSYKAKVLFQDESSMRKAMIPDGLPNFEALVMDRHLIVELENKTITES